MLAAAARTLEGHVVRTPLLESDLLNQLVRKRLGVQARVLIKAECLQHTGAFKFRGALNRLLADDMDAAARRRGVVAFSSGNFAQEVDTLCTFLPLQREWAHDPRRPWLLQLIGPGPSARWSVRTMRARPGSN